LPLSPRPHGYEPELIPESRRPFLPKFVADGAFTAGNRAWVLIRIMLYVVWASLPLLAIVGHVFGLVSQRNSAMLVVPLGVALVALAVVAPHPSDVIVRRGFVAGMVACVPYDVFRLTAVHVGGWMGDFIPKLGVWITGDSGAGAVAVAYLWRYLGDAAGAGVGFYVVAFALGLHHSSRPGQVVLAAIGYAVFPVWLGLIGLVALAPRGEELMFRLTPATVLITLIGHLMFGLVLGLLFVRERHIGAHWPWPPISLPALRRKQTMALRRGRERQREPGPTPPSRPPAPTSRTSAAASRGARPRRDHSRSSWPPSCASARGDAVRMHASPCGDGAAAVEVAPPTQNRGHGVGVQAENRDAALPNADFRALPSGPDAPLDSTLATEALDFVCGHVNAPISERVLSTGVHRYRRVH
jgi:hypothetical protein